MVALPIKNDQAIFGYWLVGHFLTDNVQKDEELLNFFKQVAEVVSLNRIFTARSLQDKSFCLELHSIM